MAESVVHRKTFPTETEVSGEKSMDLEHLETVSSLGAENNYKTMKKADYLTLVTGLMNSSNNRDFYTMNQMLDPLIDNRRVGFLDSVSALHWCCYAGHVDLVNRLLDVGCDPFLADPVNYETPVYYAIKSSNSYIISILLKRFGPLILCHENVKCKTPFLVAVSEFTCDNLVAVLHVLEFLYLSGVSVDEQDNNGTSALMYACKRGQLFVVQWLLRRGADISHRDHYGATVLHYAALSPNLDVLLFLAQNGLAPLTWIKSISNNDYNEVFDQTPMDLCWEKANHLRYMLLWLFWLQWKVFGKVFRFNMFYPILYWIMNLFNLALVIPMYRSLKDSTNFPNSVFYSCLAFFLATNALWIINKLSDPGVAPNNKNDRTRAFSPTNDDVGGFEGVLESLHRRQQMVNFEFYCVNRDLRRHFITSKGLDYSRRHKSGYVDEELYEPLNDEELGNPFVSRVTACNDEINNITTEMRSVYPQVADERCNKNSINYNKAVLNFDTTNKVCFTCGKTKAPREHHCSLCNTCLLRQDHHCGWIDNCVGAGNQREFFVFLTLLVFVFWHFYLILCKYLAHRFQGGFSLFDVFLFLYGFIANGLMFIFVLYLWTRIVRCMITDVTYYEFLKKPSHIRVRFKGNVHDRFWDFADLNFKNVFNNILKFWTNNLV
uniref:Palmitoyltransferase n=1 Tax=Theileria annulata TaxID=5874 RepID=A0A3B0N5P1_THEAN